MARPLRIDVSDGWYHVTCRGIERRNLFTCDADREHFLSLLEKVADRFFIRVHAYALMDNHFHLLVSTPDANLSSTMQWLKLSYSAWFNARYNRVGPLFQGRFKSVPVENNAWGFEVSLYIHLNPVMLSRLGLGKREKRAESLGWRLPDKEQVKKRLSKLRSFKWSSYSFYAGYRKVPAWLCVDDVLVRASKERSEQHKVYRSAAKQRVTKGLPEDLRERLMEGFAIGAESFRKMVRSESKMGREITGKSKLRHRISYDALVILVEKIRGKRTSEFLDNRGDWGKPLLMWGARHYCGFSLREIGERLGGVDYAAVSIMLKRFERKCENDRVLAGKVATLRNEVLKVET